MRVHEGHGDGERDGESAVSVWLGMEHLGEKNFIDRSSVKLLDGMTVTTGCQSLSLNGGRDGSW